MDSPTQSSNRPQPQSRPLIKQPENKPYRFIDLGDGQIAIVDDYNYGWLKKYPWEPHKYFRSYYARYTIDRFPKPINIYLHRLVAHTPKGMVTHHRNRNTLDNRRANLLNLTPKDHHALHQNGSLLIKFETVGPQPIVLDGFF